MAPEDSIQMAAMIRAIIHTTMRPRIVSMVSRPTIQTIKMVAATQSGQTRLTKLMAGYHSTILSGTTFLTVRDVEDRCKFQILTGIKTTLLAMTSINLARDGSGATQS